MSHAYKKVKKGKEVPIQLSEIQHYKNLQNFIFTILIPLQFIIKLCELGYQEYNVICYNNINDISL